MAEPVWLYNTGPVDIYVGASSLDINVNGASLTTGVHPSTVSVTPYYAGTCEQYPVVEGTVSWGPVFNDIGGPMESFDEEFQGQSKIIVLDMNRFNETNLNIYDMDDGDGSEATNARGKLLLANGQYVRLWMKFRNFGTINQIAPDLPAGEMYWATKMINKYYDRLGSVVRKTRLIIGARPVYYPGAKKFLLYSRNSTHFNGLPEPG